MGAADQAGGPESQATVAGGGDQPAVGVDDDDLPACQLTAQVYSPGNYMMLHDHSDRKAASHRLIEDVDGFHGGSRGIDLRLPGQEHPLGVDDGSGLQPIDVDAVGQAGSVQRDRVPTGLLVCFDQPRDLTPGHVEHEESHTRCLG